MADDDLLTSDQAAAAEAAQTAALRMRRAVLHDDQPYGEASLQPEQEPQPAAGGSPYAQFRDNEAEQQNPYAQFRDDPADDGIGLLERQRLNRQEAFYRGTLAGSARLAMLANVFSNPDNPETDPYHGRFNDALRKEYRGVVADLAAYDQMRPWYGEKTMTGALASLSGQLEGSLMSPESFVGWGAKGATLLGRMGRAALQQGAIQGAVDPLVQGLSNVAGVESGYDPLRTATAAGMGAVIGGGMHAAGEMIGQALLRKQLRELGREDPAFLGIVEPEPPGATPPQETSPSQAGAQETAAPKPEQPTPAPAGVEGEGGVAAAERSPGTAAPPSATEQPADSLAGTAWAQYGSADRLREQISQWRQVIEKEPDSPLAPHLSAMAEDAERFLNERVAPPAAAEGKPAGAEEVRGEGEPPTEAAAQGGRQPSAEARTEAQPPSVENGALPKAGEAEPPPATTGAARSANVPSEVPEELFRGSGREDIGSAYNPTGAAVPIAGPGQYFSFDREHAGTFGPNVATAHLGDVVRNPLVITDGAQWRALTREAGWEVPNPFGKPKAETRAMTARLQQVAKAKGHDGIVVWWDDKSPYDVGPKGENIKLLRNVFDKPQVISFRERVPETTGVAASAAPQTEGASFTTSRGSIYVVHEDGTTTRNKAARDQVGHEGDSGPKERSAKTVYVDPKVAPQFNPASSSPWRIVDHGDGTLSIAYRREDGRWGISADDRNIKVETQPRVGLSPVELWRPDTINGRPAYRGVHPGNPITEIQGGGAAAIGGAGSIERLSDEDLLAEANRLVGADLTNPQTRQNYFDVVQELTRRGKLSLGEGNGGPRGGELRDFVARPRVPASPEPGTTVPGLPKPVELIGAAVPNMAPHRVASADGRSVDVAPVVVEASDLLTSADGGYDASLQPRQRDRAASQAQIREIATRLEPERLGMSAEADRGAPIVGPDRMVESGNGRVLAVRRAYEQSGEAAQRYRAWLAGQGVDVSRYREPVLVRQRTTPLSIEDRRGFTVAANQSATLSLSAPERAMADARHIDSDMLGLIRNADDLGAASNRDFVRSFVAKLPQSEQGAVTTAEGALSAEGLGRIRNAVLARAYGSADVLSRVAEATSDDVKSISNALLAAAPDWARLRADVEAGRVRSDVDLTDALIEAVSRTADIRAKGVKLDAHLAQQDAFDRLAEPVESFMRLFYDPAGRRALSGHRIAERLRFYAEEARKVTAEAGLDLGLPQVTARDIQRAALNRGTGDEGRQSGLFLRGGTGVREGGEAGGQQGRGRGPFESGGGAGEPGAVRTGPGQAGPSAAQLTSRSRGKSRDTWRAVLDVPEVRAAIEHPQIERGGDVPFGAGADNRPGITHLDQHLPQSIDVRTTDGRGTRAIDPGEPLNVHEQVEKYVMEKLIAQGMSRERAYFIAHHHFAVPAERDWVESRGLSWSHYTEVIAGYLDHIEHEHPTHPPAGLYTKPYPHNEAEFLRRAGGEPRGPGVATGDELALAQRRTGGTLRMEQQRAAQGVPTASTTTGGLPATIAPAPSLEQTTAIRSLQQQAISLAEAIGFPLRQGRVRVRNALGVFNTRTGVVRVKEVPDFEVVAHEAGHAIEAKAGDALTRLTEQFAGELAPLVPNAAAYDPSLHVKEGFAEFIRRFLGNPNAAEKVAPGFAVAFRDFMQKNHPDMMAALDRASQAYRAYLDAPSIDAVGAVRRSQAEHVEGWRRVLHQIREDGFPAVVKSFFQRAYTAILDDKAPITRAVRDLGRAIREETGKLVQLKDADNPDVLFRMVGRSTQASIQDMQRGVRPYHGVTPEGPSLADAITKAIGAASVWGKWDPAKKADFSNFLIARRAEFLWRKFKAGLLPNPPAAFSHADARVAMAELGRANPNFRDASDMVHAYTRQLLKKQFDGGLIDADLYNKLLGEEFYVPFFRDMSDKPLAEGGNPAGRPSNPEGPGAYSTVKRMTGSARDIQDPIESLMMQTFLVNRTIRHNDVIRAFTKLARRAGIEGGRYVEPVPAKEAVKYTVNVSEVLERKARELGIDPDDAKVLASSVGDQFGGEDPIMGSYFRMEQAKSRGEPIVFYKDGGQLKAARFMAGKEGHALYETLTAAPEPITDLWVDLIRGAAVIKRSGIVTNPTFALSNYIRDQIAVSLLRTDYVPIVSGLRGIASEVRQGQAAQLYAYAGGVAGGASTGPIDKAVEREIDALAKRGYAVNRFTSLKGLLEASSITEAGTRNSVFAKVFEAKKRQGLSDYEAMIEAAYQSQDLLDFSRHGSHTLAIRQLLPFINAHMQGLDKAYRTIIDPMITKLRNDQVFGRESGEFRNAMASVLKVAGLGSALGAVWAAINWEKEAYRDASPYFKGTHFVVPIGDKLLIVPKPFELATGFTAGEYAFARWMKNDPRAASQFLDAAWQALSPPNALTDIPVLSTVMQLYTGKSLFTGRDIVPGEYQKLAPEQQYNERTSAAARILGNAIGVSPMKVDFAIGDQFGTWGRDIMALSQGVDRDAPALNMEDRALLRRFIKDPSRTSDITTRFWDYMGQTTGKYNQDVATYDFLVKGFQDDQAKQFLDKLPAGERTFVTMRSAATEDGRAAFNADERRMHPLQRAYDAVSVLNGLRKELTNNSFKDFETLTNLKLPDTTRRDLLTDIRELAQTEMRNALVILKEPGYADRPVLNVNDTMTKIRALSPAVANEIATRYATNKIPTTATVQQSWPILRDEVLRHGSDADVADLALDAKAEGYEFGGDRVKRPQKRKITIQPGAAAH